MAKEQIQPTQSKLSETRINSPKLPHPMPRTQSWTIKRKMYRGEKTGK